MNDITVREEQLRLITEHLASFFAPETKSEYSATENRVIDLCGERVHATLLQMPKRHSSWRNC
jgi:hypothetical protein